MMAALGFGALIGYLLGHVVSDSIWKGRFEQLNQVEEKEWEEVIPAKHIKRKRRYS
jgi:membrane protein YqaA with SNARE-associated domain